MKRTLAFISILFLYTGLWAQNTKAKYGTFALTNASIETVTTGVIQNGTVLIENGKITGVGPSIEVPADAEVIDCLGKWIYPGMIDGGTILGLTEIVGDQRTEDVNEIGDIVPQLKALTAVNPQSVAIPITRVNGVTTALASPGALGTAPFPSRLPGTAALINLTGYTPDQMFAGFEGLVLNFPTTSRRNNNDQRSDEERMKIFNDGIKSLNDVWEKAGQYNVIDLASGGKGVGYNPELEALIPVIRGERALLIEVNVAKDILYALQWIREKEIQKPILTGVFEGWRVAHEIANANVPVIAGPVIALPSRTYDNFDRPYMNPGILQKAGVKVAIRSVENNDSNFRNLPYHAGFAAAYGMGREEALKAVTIIPAEIFGVSDKLGSIEVGKSANLFICDGDPFEPKTEVSQVFIGGWMIPMESRQSLLYEEFLDREPGLTDKSTK